jgi:ankyrin repeat protein
MECKGIPSIMIVPLSHSLTQVFCQLEVLRRCFPANLRQALEELPKSLDETYKRILNEINNENWKLAYRLLQCLAVALRPLLVEELAEVLAFNLTPGRIPILNANWRWEDEEEAVLSACSSLVSVIVDHGSRVVQFSHFSVKEFLTSNRLASRGLEDVSLFHIPIEPSHAILAQACLGVLLCLDDRTNKDSVKKIPLYRYASEYWVAHARVGNVEFQIKDAMDYFFDMDNPHFSAWIRIEHPHEFLKVAINEAPTGVPRPAAPLYFAAMNGFHSLVGRLIIKHSEQVNQLGGYYGTPLHASVRGGHIDVSRLLVAHGADINSRCADNWTPLHDALEHGHLMIGKWLLDHSADVSSQQHHGSTPLHLAASNGYLEMCQILLERDAEVNSRNNDGSTPFLAALESECPDVARFLLDHNADVRVHDNKGNSPLHLAASKGYLEICRILLERDAEVNSRNNDGSTPFLAALKSARPDIARFLLDYNADVHVHDNKGNTPLHFAARYGFLIARQLLERNAEVNRGNHHGSTPLLLSSEYGHTDIVQLLLDHNADVDVRDGDGDTPLHCAAFSGKPDVTWILLELNVEVNSRNDKGSTPLHYASAGSTGGSADVVRLLLNYGADVQVRNLKGETASEMACGPEQEEIVRLLSQHAAE